MLDIPPRLRLVLLVAAIGGFIFIVMGSLHATGEQQVHLDKLVHSVGYGLLGMLVIMSLPPIWYIPALVGIALAGLGLEWAQATVVSGRSADLKDALANGKGLAAGACVGFLARMVWIFVRKELVAMSDRRNLESFADGDTIFATGDDPEFVYVVREGRVSIVVENEDGKTKIGDLGKGEVFGEMGVIDGEKRSASAVAVGDVILYRMSSDKLQETVEGREHPVLPIARTLAKRLREANAKIIDA